LIKVTHSVVEEENASAIWVNDTPSGLHEVDKREVCTQMDHKEALQNQYLQLKKKRVMK
jgi:hypothetical protein